MGYFAFFNIIIAVSPFTREMQEIRQGQTGRQNNWLTRYDFIENCQKC